MKRGFAVGVCHPCISTMVKQSTGYKRITLNANSVMKCRVAGVVLTCGVAIVC